MGGVDPCWRHPISCISSVGPGVTSMTGGLLHANHVSRLKLGSKYTSREVQLHAAVASRHGLPRSQSAVSVEFHARSDTAAANASKPIGRTK